MSKFTKLAIASSALLLVVACRGNGHGPNVAPIQQESAQDANKNCTQPLIKALGDLHDAMSTPQTGCKAKKCVDQKVVLKCRSVQLRFGSKYDCTEKDTKGTVIFNARAADVKQECDDYAAGK